MHAFCFSPKDFRSCRLILLNFITRITLARGTFHESLQYAVCSSLLQPSPTSARIYSPFSYFQTPSFYIVPKCETPRLTPIQNNMQNCQASSCVSEVFEICRSILFCLNRAHLKRDKIFFIPFYDVISWCNVTSFGVVVHENSAYSSERLSVCLSVEIPPFYCSP